MEHPIRIAQLRADQVHDYCDEYRKKGGPDEHARVIEHLKPTWWIVVVCCLDFLELEGYLDWQRKDSHKTVMSVLTAVRMVAIRRRRSKM